MKVIYNILESEDNKRTQDIIRKGKSGYRIKWGLYGTIEWFNNLRADNLIECINGKISRITMTGHNDFPMVEIDNGVNNFQFQVLGNEILYKPGLTIKIECIKNKYISPSSSLEELLIPLIIKIEE